MKKQTSMMLTGIFLMVLGLLAMMTPTFTGSTVVVLVGLVLLIAGISQLIHGVKAKGFKEKALPLILGSLMALAGLLVIGHPLMGLSFLTLVLMTFFLVEGIWKIALSFSYRSSSAWVWMLFGGILSLFLGLLIYAQWPLSGMLAVGILVGIDLLVTGLSLVILSINLPKLLPQTK